MIISGGFTRLFRIPGRNKQQQQKNQGRENHQRIRMFSWIKVYGLQIAMAEKITSIIN